MAAQVLAARLMAQVPSARAPVARAPERPEEPELAQEQVPVARVPVQPEAVEARGPLQVVAPLRPGAAPEVEQESARAGSEGEPELGIRPEELAALRHRAGAVQQARASLLPERWE